MGKECARSMDNGVAQLHTVDVSEPYLCQDNVLLIVLGLVDVDCGRPSVIPNGRGYLVNGTTYFGSIVEYHCLPDFKMISQSQHRICQANGEW